MTLPVRNPDLGFQPGDYVCAFFVNGLIIQNLYCVPKQQHPSEL